MAHLALRRAVPVLVSFMTLVLAPDLATAQLGRITDSAKRAAESEASRQVDRKVREAVACAFGDDRCVEEAERDGRSVVITDESGEVITDEEGEPVTSMEQARERADEPGTGVWRNYDFVPGSEVWFALDLEDEPVGRFPASQLEYLEGNAQVVELDGERVLEFTSTTTFYVNLPGPLPEDYTVEFRSRTGAPNMSTIVAFDPLKKDRVGYRAYDRHYLNVWRGGGIARRGSMVSSTDNQWRIAEELVPIRFQVDDSYAIMYMGTDRVANLPNADFGRSNVIEFEVRANASRPSYLADLVVAVGLDDLYRSLSETGEWTTRGILFDVDSDALRPESTPVLQEIRRTLERHGDLSIVIEGHTDSMGDDAHNQDLSERRARAVVDYLVGNGIDASRLTAVGKGESEPVSDNATPEGRQSNRRVVVRSAG